jgi:hypothetical protein
MASPAEILITLGICRVGQPFHKVGLPSPFPVRHIYLVDKVNKVHVPELVLKRRSRRPSMINLLLPWGHFSSSYIFQFFSNLLVILGFTLVRGLVRLRLGILLPSSQRPGYPSEWDKSAESALPQVAASPDSPSTQPNYSTSLTSRRSSS